MLVNDVRSSYTQHRIRSCWRAGAVWRSIGMYVHLDDWWVTGCWQLIARDSVPTNLKSTSDSRSLFYFLFFLLFCSIFQHFLFYPLFLLFSNIFPFHFFPFFPFSFHLFSFPFSSLLWGHQTFRPATGPVGSAPGRETVCGTIILAKNRASAGWQKFGMNP